MTLCKEGEKLLFYSQDYTHSVIHRWIPTLKHTYTQRHIYIYIYIYIYILSFERKINGELFSLIIFYHSVWLGFELFEFRVQVCSQLVQFTLVHKGYDDHYCHNKPQIGNWAAVWVTSCPEETFHILIRSILEAYSLCTSSLGCKASDVVTSFLVHLSICWRFYLVYFKKGAEDLTVS